RNRVDSIILRKLAEKGENIISEFSEIVPSQSSKAKSVKKIKPPGKILIRYSNKKTKYVKELQAYLTGIPGIFLKEDGIPLKKTSEAMKNVFGFYLKGDKRK